jgi:hypothetical protein
MNKRPVRSRSRWANGSTSCSSSVIVDMAAQNRGNVEGTVKDQAVVTDNGVTIIGYTDLAGRLSAQASQLYGTNVVDLLKLMSPEKDGQQCVRGRILHARGVRIVQWRNVPAWCGGHGFGHKTRWNRCEQARRGETAWTAERR